MSHHIYHTEAFILASRSHGEANKFITLFTRELGVISAHAQGIRLLRSRLRYILQDYSLARVDMVRGREFWRITSGSAYSGDVHSINTHSRIESINKLYNANENINAYAQERALLARVFALIERLYRGEEPNEGLFDDILKLSEFLIERRKITQQVDEIEIIEIIFVIRVLAHLGYWPEQENEYAVVLLSDSLLDLTRIHKRKLIGLINESLRSSQL